MNILFLSIGRLNSIEDKGIYTDLLRCFRNEGHQVYVVTPLEKRLNKATSYVNENGVKFVKVKIGNITKVRSLEKGISTLRIENQFLKAIKDHLSNIKFDLVIYSTPPITFGKVISYIKKRDNAKSYLLLKDIFPQNAVDLNMFSNKSIIYKYFRIKEKKLYKQSDYIGCMSQANVNFVLNQNPNLNAQIVEISPNSINPVKIDTDDRDKKRIRDKYNIPVDKTVFIYGGNLGKPQGIDFLIECLEVNKENSNVYFVIAGSGTEFNKIQTYFKASKPLNAKLFSELPKEDYEILVNSCDVGLIFLDHRFTIPNFPSRLLSYMQAAMPVLAATDPNTDIGQIVEQGQFGCWCESNDVQAFNQKIKELSDEAVRKKMGNNARKYLEENYTSKHTYEVIMSHFG
ncbi:glycosyltransferase family 4 protein [Planococcus lenghuensis]|uniref:Glycosyltransferase WbuB n=1 Tax=Planococcus lenghuensis TaxID=2213202 RepID=A0A1Q2L1C1_9BACL|nr:glycosyltransferase family 4 protein [Planococcus lenghuensis]AQQ54206.1 glycosyltransferase WbuB [Planococcus lenghuensis]